MYRKYIFARKYCGMTSKNNLTCLERKFVSISILLFPLVNMFPTPSSSMHGISTTEVHFIT
jgi:hypothetical protein